MLIDVEHLMKALDVLQPILLEARGTATAGVFFTYGENAVKIETRSKFRAGEVRVPAPGPRMVRTPKLWMAPDVVRTALTTMRFTYGTSLDLVRADARRWFLQTPQRKRVPRITLALYAAPDVTEPTIQLPSGGPGRAIVLGSAIAEAVAACRSLAGPHVDLHVGGGQEAIVIRTCPAAATHLHASFTIAPYYTPR